MGAVLLARSRVMAFPPLSSSMLPSMGLPFQGWNLSLSGRRPALTRSRVSTP